ncbi:MAG: cation-transporting P-type ATPase, partial [Dehalococcoidia bacterium]
IFALVVCAAIAAAGVARGYGATDMFIWGVALAVAVIPEALPAVVTISLALGVRRMVKRHALIRKLQAVETLGCASVICSDKTGTLTRDEMTVRRIWAGGQTIEVTGAGYEPKGEFKMNGITFDHSQSVQLEALLRGGLLCNDAHLVSLEGSWDIKGDPTEGALVVAAAKAGLRQDELANRYPRVGEIPFSSETKRMTTIHTGPQGRLAYSKGAAEVILESCSAIHRDGRDIEMSQQDRELVLEIARQWASDALRVLGIAYKPLAADTGSAIDAERDMVLVGLVGMIDPPREEVKGAIELCRAAGIKPVMITGDHKLTAVAIARELGLLKENGLALSGAELDKINDAEFEKMVEQIDVYARTSPAHKMRIVDAFSRKGHVVAMTGDGVNDAPALKKADIGIAMGITGTDVSREAAAMVLTDDNFASIVAAVEEGRSIFANIRKYLVYLLSGNLGAVIGMVATLLAGLPLPLSAVQILFINLLMDGAPAVALGVEPPEQGIMKQPPRDPRKSIFDSHTLGYIGGVGVWISLGALFTYMWMLHSGDDLVQSKAMTMFFATLITMRLCNAFNCRSAKGSLFRMGLFTNKWLIYAAASSFAMMLLVIYVPALQGTFETVSLGLADWVMIGLVALSLLIVVEIAKQVLAWRARSS